MSSPRTSAWFSTYWLDLQQQTHPKEGLLNGLQASLLSVVKAIVSSLGIGVRISHVLRLVSVLQALNWRTRAPRLLVQMRSSFRNYLPRSTVSSRARARIFTSGSRCIGRAVVEPRSS